MRILTVVRADVRRVDVRVLRAIVVITLLVLFRANGVGEGGIAVVTEMH